MQSKNKVGFLIKSKFEKSLNIMYCRHLVEEMQLEHRALAMEDSEDKRKNSFELMMQLEKLQNQVEEAITVTAKDVEAERKLEDEVRTLESLIKDKKQKLEILVQDIKDANLHSLSIAPATDDGIRSCLLEGELFKLV